MEIQLVTIRQRRLAPDSPEAALISRYTERSAHSTLCSVREFESEDAMLRSLERGGRRTMPFLVLAESSGKLLTSKEFAAAVQRAQDGGTQQFFLAIGPADGWSATAIARANLMISFGRMTLPHELAAVVAAEQIYRALTILAGHPYHCGH